MNLVAQATLLVSFPVAASVVGATVAAVRPPGLRAVRWVQHFAAGVVLAALVGEIMPELQRAGHLGWTVLSFAAGALLVLTLGAYGRRTEVAVPVGRLAAIAINLLLDGVLIGLGARLGLIQGVILTVALTLEMLFLSLSVSADLTLRGISLPSASITCAALGFTTAVGAITGAALLGEVGSTVMSAVLAFGAAALLHLAVEALLVEAHEEKESMLLGAVFFLGFIAIYVLSALGS
jgi:ZIP family zinc transporter